MTASDALVYFEVDTIGNVRHLHTDAAVRGTLGAGDLGGYSYTAFGTTIAPGDVGGVAAPVGVTQPFGWQGKRLIAPNLYDSRARVWSAELGAFLQPDEYVFLGRSGTLWSWPGQNPYRWRDPSGRYAIGLFGIVAGGAEIGAGYLLLPVGIAFYAGYDIYNQLRDFHNPIITHADPGQEEAKAPCPEAGGSGAKKPPGRAAPPAPAPENYRGRYNADRASKGLPRLSPEEDAHHRIPQAYRDHPEFEGFDFDAPQNIRGVPGSRADVNVHQQITNQWSEFQRSFPLATRGQIEAFADAIDLLYGL